MAAYRIVLRPLLERMSGTLRADEETEHRGEVELKDAHLKI
jgi:hypothetical protein